MRKCLFIMLVFLVSCSSSQLTTSRTEFRLFKFEDFIISNIYVNPRYLDRDSSTISFDYKLLIKNTRAETRHLNLKEAKIIIGLRQLPISCKPISDDNSEFDIAPDETLAVSCLVKINKQEGMFQISDYKAVIDLPIEAKSLQFAYLLRTEDFR